MYDLKEFKNYLVKNTNLEDGTIRNYLSSIRKIFDYFKIDSFNLTVTSFQELFTMFYNDENIIKFDKKSHRRLEAALKYYEKFLLGEKIKSEKKKEFWTDFEMDMTLGLYFLYGRINANNPNLIDFTDKLNKLTGNHKPYKSIELRLGNYAAVDPNYHGKGLSQNSKDLKNKKYYRSWYRNVQNKKNLMERVNNLIKQTHFNNEIINDDDQFERINKGKVKEYTKRELEEISKKNYEFSIDKKKQHIVDSRNTDARLKATRMRMAHFKCEIDCNHITFTRSDGKYQYMESHHLIPIHAQSDKLFRYINLDSLCNLLCICPICHAQVHYGSREEKKKIFYKMYNIRRNELMKFGINESIMEKVFEKYYSLGREEIERNNEII